MHTPNLLIPASAGLKTGPSMQPPQQQPQRPEQQRVPEARQLRRYLQHPNQPLKDRDSRKGIRHSSVLSTSVVHGSSLGKLSPKQRPAFKRHHTDTPRTSTKEVPPASKNISKVNANNDRVNRTAVPKTVTIRHLPESNLDASFGHHANRNEKYARIRLAALREHQQALVKILSDLLETESRFRQHCQHVEQEQVVATGHSGVQPHSKVQALRNTKAHAPPPICQHYHKREVAAHEYQKALLDLWQVDNSLCHWLIRYIRTARRVSRNLNFMLLDSSAASAFGSPVSLNRNNASSTDHDHNNVMRPVMGALAANAQCSTLDLMSTTLPHEDEVTRWKGQSATLRQADKTLKTLDPVMRCSPRVSDLSAPSSHALLRLPIQQAPTAPPPPVPAPQPPRDFLMKIAPEPRLTPQLAAQMHTPWHRKDRFRSSGKAAIAGSDLTEEKRFRDYDELDATVFVGRHMQSLQKANEFLYRFDREASHSTIALERLENAREVYRRLVNRG
ncbi:hypothetical protein EC968_009743 [Mortierella alpina]|nr:hypothetical protein EC968_009743 [Mortierella alpina]